MQPHLPPRARVPWFPLLLGVALFGFFVWPTPWSTSLIGGNTWRFHRLSGCTEVRTPTGWTSAGQNRCDGQGVNAPQQAAAEPEGTAQPDLSAVVNPFGSASPEVWTSQLSDSEVGQVISALSTRMRVTRAWTAMEDGVPTFFVDVQNDSGCAVNTVVLSVSDPVYGDVPGITLDNAAGADPSSDPVLTSGGHARGSMVNAKVMELPAEEVPVSRLTVDWGSVLPVPGEARGCEDHAAGS